jgi:aminoglycoside phosphotransferase (APT) family kinase protein
VGRAAGHPGRAQRLGQQDLPPRRGHVGAAAQRIDPTGGPPPGRHNFFRGGPLETYDAETRDAIAALGDRVPAEAAALWEAALAAPWHGPPVWVHGDVAAGNLLVRDGRLSAVIDFGSCGVGDPACDVTIAWTLLSGPSREAFRAALPLDAATWARGRGWALWKALITLAGTIDGDPVVAATARRVVDEVLADQGRSG